MLVIDNKFRKIDNDITIRFDVVLNQIIKKLDEIVIDEGTRNIIKENSESIIVQLTDGVNYSLRIPNGNILTRQFPSNAGAFKTNMYNEQLPNEFHIMPGIALRKNFNEHDLTHELIHSLSFNQHNYYKEDGTFNTKTGTKIDYYDKNGNDKLVDYNASSDGINEGITELLTSKITNNYHMGNYAPFVALSQILIDANPNLLKAYFSRDVSELEKFYEDLETKQTSITRFDLTNLSSKETDLNILAKIINGAISYDKANNSNFNEEQLNNLINYLDTSYMLDAGSWSDLISINQSMKM